MPDDFILIYI